MLWRTSAGSAVAAVGACAVGLVASMPAQTSITAAMLRDQRTASVTAADPDAQAPATSLESALHAAAAAADVVFAGEVVSIDRTPGAVIVRWRVEHAVAGATTGTAYEQKEWTGLWAGGDARYQVGERALVLLHAPSVGGYAAPVEDGVIPLRGDVVTGTLDLRWLARQVLVTDAARLRPMQALQAAGGDFALGDSLMRRAANVASAPRALAEPATGGIGSMSGTVPVSAPADTPPDDANAHIDGSMVLGMLHAWRRAEAAGQ